MPLASALLSVLAAVVSTAPVGGRVLVEWEPGFDEGELGGELVVDAYGVNGLGAYRVGNGDGSVLAVCIQADVGHTTTAEYAPDPSVRLGTELGYLTWAYLAPGRTTTDEEAAAVNALAWRYAGAQRRGGGPVWAREQLEVRVLGVGRLRAVEEAIARIAGEVTARRGPWTLRDATVDRDTASVRVIGPGGPIGGVTVRFEGAAGWRAEAGTAADGTARVVVPAGVENARAAVETPGEAVALVAPGSQRLATAGPPVVVAVTFPPPPTTTTTPPPPTTTTTTSSTSTTTTTSPPSTTTTTSTSTTTPPTTTSTPTTTPTTTTPPTTTPPTTTTTTPATPPTTTSVGPPPTVPAPGPPELPRTGSAVRGLTRAASVLVAVGAFVVLAATPRRRVSDRRGGR